MGDPEPKIPRLKAGADFTSLPLEPAEGYILSQIDGATGVREIGSLTGLGEARVQQLVEKLEKHEALEWVAAPVGARQQRPKTRKANRRSAKPRRRSSAPKVNKYVPPGQLYDPAELDEAGVDIELEHRKMILEMFYRMDELTFYEVLDIHPDADKTEVRTAYFKLSKKFHPDARYGKELGTYKRKMEAVFQRLTEAYEVLGKQKRRKEYNAYIAIRLKTLRAEREIDLVNKAAERMATQVAEGIPIELPDDSPLPDFEPAPPTKPDPEAIAAPAAAKAGTSSAPAAAKAGTSSAPAAAKAGTSSAPRRTAAAVRNTKRQLMARKIAAAAGRHVPGTPPPSGRVSAPAPKASKEQLLRGLTSSLKASANFTGGIDVANRYIEQAKQLEAEGDLAAAGNALRLAVAMDPDRPDLAEHYDRVALAAAGALAQSYVAQAQYEENNQKWADASLSWAKVCDGRPNDVLPHWKAALCTVTAAGDLKRAKVYAQMAVDLDSEDFNAQKTLGLVFHAAGMAQNALRVLEAASALDCRDEMVENLLRELRR